MATKFKSDRANYTLRTERHEGQVCRQCVMDTSDPDISFDEFGICSHCHEYNRRIHDDLPGGDRQAYLDGIIGQIQRTGRARPYDCVIGVSGGIDSTYVAWLCKRVLGLRPLAVHLDNGWNTELAVQNIATILQTLDIDLYTHVIDWEEFRDLQVSFLKSGISNWELPTDHAIRALLYREAARRGIKYIITGSNLATEAVMPAAWVADNIDLRLLNSIQLQFGTRKLKSYPRLSLTRLAWDTFARGIRQIPLLNYVNYNKAEVTALLERELGWRPYEFKHGESLFTRFFQRHYLPRKFGYDKRKPHLSNLILSGQITRDAALAELNQPLYYPDELDRDLSYVAKKLALTPAQLETYIAEPPQPNHAYNNSSWVRQRLPGIVALAKRVATARSFKRRTARRAGINLHIYPSPIRLESRILRITEALQRWSTFDSISIVGMQDGRLPVRQRIDDRREIVRVKAPFQNSQWLPQRLARFVGWYARCFMQFQNAPVACISCHSLSTLPLGWLLKVRTGAKLIYDTHELETETINTKGLKRVLAKATEAVLIRSANAVVVVGPKIAEWYRQRYVGLAPVVVRNLPESEYNAERLDLFRELLGIPKDELVFFYQGILDNGRGVDTTLAAFISAPSDRHVVFLGFGPKSEAIRQHAKRHSNIHFLPAVPPNRLRDYTRSGDVGLCLIEPACLSYVYCMPNKLFEYLGSGVPAIVTALPELSTIVNGNQCGWTIENDAQELSQLVASIAREDIVARGMRGLRWAENNTWENECETLKAVYECLGFVTPQSSGSAVPLSAATGAGKAVK